jgi:superfamily II DNA helicase RecQ
MSSLLEVYRSVQRKYPALPANLKPEQLTIVGNLLGGKNTFGVLPTGYGKSICYALPALFKDEVIAH